jgi:(E)-4-hydroxy-3-methylbut-2-enyl-diphosphate synthase
MPPFFKSRTIQIGGLSLGGDAPVRIQSMTSTDTNRLDESTDQCIRMIRAGAEMVRLTTQGSREVRSLARIRDMLRTRGYDIPLVADIHFRPDLAVEAARVADKIRINPGNYLKGGNVETLLPRLLEECREHGTAIRIGVNHGSLDEQILREYGDTPAGMVESAMRFLRICKKHGMEKIVVSMKSSNPRVMIQSVRLLTRNMAAEGMDYPLHLGLTEAGDGVEGRIRSVAGIAPLLLEGLGDTIRVSLTEPPEEELPVARQILELFPKPKEPEGDPFTGLAWDPFGYRRRTSQPVMGIGDASPVKIVSPHPPVPGEDPDPKKLTSFLIPYETWQEDPGRMGSGSRVLLLERGGNSLREARALLNSYCLRDTQSPVIYKTFSREKNPDLFRMELAGELAMMLVDGAVDAVWVENLNFGQAFMNETILGILQACGARNSRIEYISCPSCGRTHFDILARLKEIREATSHLKPMKIGVMGCIVNGPGEMAGADYGYVGAGPGKVTLYRGMKPVRKNIPEEEALEALIELIRKEGEWSDPPD